MFGILCFARMLNCCTFVAYKKNLMTKMTQKEAVEQALHRLGGRATLRDIYPLAMELGDFSGSRDQKATIRNCLQKNPDVFHRSPDSPSGWWELTGFQEEIARRDRRIRELEEKVEQSVSVDQIIEGFNDLATAEQRIHYRSVLNDLLADNPCWKTARNIMRERGYFSAGDVITTINNNFNAPVGIVKNKEIL